MKKMTVSNITSDNDSKTFALIVSAVTNCKLYLIILKLGNIFHSGKICETRINLQKLMHS